MLIITTRFFVNRNLELGRNFKENVIIKNNIAYSTKCSKKGIELYKGFFLLTTKVKKKTTRVLIRFASCQILNEKKYDHLKYAMEYKTLKNVE